MTPAYTQHALARMAERGISRSEVEATLAQPLRTVAALNGRTESQGWIERAGKRQLLRVLGIEMLDVSLCTDNPHELAMELVGASRA